VLLVGCGESKEELALRKKIQQDSIKHALEIEKLRKEKEEKELAEKALIEQLNAEKELREKKEYLQKEKENNP